MEPVVEKGWRMFRCAEPLMCMKCLDTSPSGTVMWMLDKVGNSQLCKGCVPPEGITPTMAKVLEGT